LEEERKKAAAKAERKALIKVALEMFADGFPLDTIAKYVKLDTDTLNSLKPVNP